mgnify:CR=1 FL=1
MKVLIYLYCEIYLYKKSKYQKLKDILNEVFDTNMLESQSKFEIYCDLDGVLVDFDKGIKQLTGGINFQDYIKTKGYDELWKIVNNNGSIWWETLPWTQDGHYLWNFIKVKKPTILTAGSTENTKELAVKGKKQWVFRNLGSNVKTIVTDKSSDKQIYSGQNKILIDDLPSNISEWESKGGIGILHTSAADTIEKLKQLGI